MDYFFIILSACFLFMGMTIYGIYFLLAYFGLNPLGWCENRLCWVASMEPICFWLLSVGSVQSFSLPDLQLRSEVDTSNNLHHSLQNSGEIKWIISLLSCLHAFYLRELQSMESTSWWHTLAWTLLVGARTGSAELLPWSRSASGCFL